MLVRTAGGKEIEVDSVHQIPGTNTRVFFVESRETPEQRKINRASFERAMGAIYTRAYGHPVKIKLLTGLGGVPLDPL